MNVSVVSVVRNQEMYERCVLHNLYLEGCELTMLDNRTENLAITERYNRFLDSIDDDRWIVFCHEDWEVKENLLHIIQKMDVCRLYGPIGVFVEEKKNVDVIIINGSVEQSPKKGGRTDIIRGRELESRVDTLDCQCCIVHSSLVREHSLRFDENLDFDMYVEDFCVNAYERAGIESYTVSVACHHHSVGILSKSFYDSLAYIRKKYASSSKRFATIVGHLSTFGGDPSRPVFKWKHLPWVLLRYKLSN